MSNKPDPAAFATFYREVRDRLLLQTWALTGDLPAAQAAVRDALTVSWHHWRKVSRLDDPESYVRPQAWSRALRRHTTRPFHKEKDVPDEVRDTLAALGKLPLVQRKVLLLAHLSRLPLDQIAREVGLARARVERELQSASSAFSLSREVESTAIPSVFAPMAAHLDDVSWPEADTLTRAGTRRRRTHTFAAAAAAVVVLLGTGWAVTSDGQSGPTLDGLRLTGPGESPSSSAPVPELESTDLVTAEQVNGRLPGRWRVDLTSDSSADDGLLLPCHRQRYAGKDVESSLVRTFTGRTPDAAVGSSAEVAGSEAGAEAAYDNALTWYAACQDSRFQLLSTEQVRRVGDEASIVLLQNWADPVRTIAVGVARTGQLTTTVAAQLPPKQLKNSTGISGLLADSVNGVCDLPEAGACARVPVTREVKPLPIGRNPAMLDEVDLPPVTGVNKPWVGTRPQRATVNLAATRCDTTSFNTDAVSKGRTRSFVIPEAARLPEEFGLTQSVGQLRNQAAARRFVEQVRTKMSSCQDRDLTVDVTELSSERAKQRDLTLWRVSVEVSDNRTVVYQMSIIREGRNVSQLGFIPADSVQMVAGDFATLSDRAQDRLGYLS
ncbi:sigma factor-like helix-turn-helix DNA-binding protein [Nocardioides insulae]|uniref:sigma factor-like helix-turn-helix DNA-binding protein n=1 Tax=Nocardioides insulae TaxID=394734 RepID=UPI00048EF326|nr:sigma factor-like helix-turn-helix DNA-binding protein [Nocardioides insulae]